MAKLIDGTRIYGSANIDNNLFVNTMNIVPTIVAAFTKANQQTNLAFSTIVANGTSLIPDSNADTLTILTTGNVSITADSSGDNMTFDLTTTGVTAATYGSSTIVPVFTVDSRGRLTSVTNTTIDTSIAVAAFTKANQQTNLAFSTVVANGTSLVADSNADTLTIRTTGNVAITADAAGDNMTFDLTTTGVTAATYGNNTIIPIITVDSRGRLTSVTNTVVDLSSKFNANGGTINGDVTITGNLTLSGNTTFINVQTYQVTDSLIYLAANNYISDLVDIGFIANYVNATGSNVHTGLMRDSGTKEYYLFQGYDKEPTNNHIDPNGNNFTISVLNANLKSSNIVLNGIVVDQWINAAFTKANQQTNLAFSTVVANGTSLVADSNADTLTILTSGNVAITADAAGDNMTFDLTTTGVTAATYGSSTIVPVFVVDSRGRLTSVTNTTIDTTIAVAAFTKANQQTNLAFSTVVANGTSLVADSNADTLTIRTTGNVAITADAAGDNLTFDLTTTGVTAATYGSSTIVPVFTVDSRGRLVSVTNTTIDTTIAVAAFTKANQQTNLAFSTVVANGTSLVADSNADTLTIRTTGNVAITADAAGDNLTFDLTTTGVTAATYGSSTIVPVFVVDSRGRLTSVSNVSISGSNSNTFNTVVANGTSLVATSSTDTLTIRTTGNVAISADAAGDNMTFDLTTTGVTAATYGSSTIVPVFTVDSRGRLTSVSNVAITGGGSSSNSIVYVSDSPPTDNTNGLLWWQSNTGSLYIRYADGDSTQWVATQQQGLGGSPTFSQPASNSIAQSPSQLLISANGLSYTSSTFASSGDASVKNYMLIGTTTNSTPQRLLHGGGNGLIPVRANTTIQYTIDIVARRTDVTGEGAGWTLKGVIDDFNGTVADVGTLYEIIVARDDTNYLVDALANNTSKSLDIIVTGVNTKLIRWVAHVQTVEVTQ